MKSISVNRREVLTLFLGDLIAFCLALWLTLFIRYGALPSWELFVSHVIPFGILFIIWTASLFVAGLYEKHTLFLRRRLGSILFNTQIANAIFAVLFFYFTPFFGINPKTNLFIYLFLSFGLLFLWRLYLYPLLFSPRRQAAVLIGSGPEMQEVITEVNENSRYPIFFKEIIDVEKVADLSFGKDIMPAVKRVKASVVVVDLQHEKVKPLLPELYQLLLEQVRCVDLGQFYEDVFDRVALSLVRYQWFFEHLDKETSWIYGAARRIFDVAVSAVLGIIVTPFCLLVAFLVLVRDGRPIFFRQERVGKNGKPFLVYKFRSMRDDQVTPLGAWLRRTRIDELPQLLTVIRGEQSLIGPRPEKPDYAELYRKTIPYYDVRYLITPGLSGWAQIYHDNHPHFTPQLESTREKLSYDLYYIKHRSLLLDVKIALKTLKILLSRSGK